MTKPFQNQSSRFWRNTLLVLGVLALAASYLFEIRDPHPGTESADNRPYIESAVQEGFKSMHARVTRVADGDTVYVRGDDGSENRVRLLAVDAPETKMDYGEKSKENLRRILRDAGNHVTILYKDRDQYGRIVGKLIADGVDVNKAQIESGNAWVYRQYLQDAQKGDPAAYLRAEEKARAERIGLWKEPNPQAPWNWRKAHPRQN